MANSTNIQLHSLTLSESGQLRAGDAHMPCLWGAVEAQDVNFGFLSYAREPIGTHGVAQVPNFGYKPEGTAPYWKASD